MTDTPDESRPWHGHPNPFEAIYQYFAAEIAAIKAQAAAPHTATVTIEPEAHHEPQA
jgi:hypothetical protein